MVVLGLGILIVTASCVIYRYRISASPHIFPLWTGEEVPKKAVAISQRDGEKDDIKHDARDMPTFTLDDGESATAQTAEQPPKTSANLGVDAEKASSAPSFKTKMLPPAPPSPKTQDRSEQSSAPLMPPPPRPIAKPPTFKVPPKPSTTLRPPPSAASTLRAPPTSSLKPSNASLAPSISTLAPSNRPSKKVLLDPGHSPLDWAHLTANPPAPTFLRGEDVPSNLIRVPPSALRYHSGRKGKNAWGVYQGKVYNLTPYMKFHPGGVDQLMRGAGKDKDGEKLFNEIHPWVSWENMLGECLIGILVSEDDAQLNGGETESKMDEMD